MSSDTPPARRSARNRRQTEGGQHDEANDRGGIVFHGADLRSEARHDNKWVEFARTTGQLLFGLFIISNIQITKLSPHAAVTHVAAWLALLASGHAAERHPALTPEQALAAFQLEVGLHIELVAAEPLVVDPVAFAFDERRRLYVVEGRGYPDPLEGGGKTTLGRIALLEDTAGDGRYDRRTEFATGLGYVNGIALWRGGVFVTAAPDIFYLKDTDGDGVADVRRVVLTGFDATKTAQLRVSHPTLGLDGKIYVTSGLNGGNVISPAHPDRAAVVFSARDGRFDPDTLEFENTGGRAQFGLAFDAFGRRFVTSNRHPVLQVMLEPWHLKRNPHFAFSDTMQQVSKVEAEAKVFPISRAAISADYIPKLMGAPHTGTFTSACGLLVFGGTGLTPAHVGNVFICEPAQNLVQRQVIRAEGASFRSDVVAPGKEFLATTDVWFRPVALGNGPDGALYVADMYRREIDHPGYVPEESRGALDFEAGKDRGRIYRIVRDGARPAAQTAGPPAERDSAELVRRLESADDWWQATAHRLLLERRDRTAVPLLEKLSVGAPRAETRARALWALHGVGGLPPDTLMAALRDPDARVREQAVALASETLEKNNPAVFAMARDPDPRVRFCAALVLGSISEAAAVPALAEIAIRDGEDRWTRAAVLSGIGARPGEFLAALQTQRGTNPKAYSLMMEQLGRIFGVGATLEACRDFLTQTLAGEGELSWRLAAVLGLADGLRGRTAVNAATETPSLATLMPGARAAALRSFYCDAAVRAAETGAPTAERLSAVALLGHTELALAGPVLAELLDARQPPELQLEAIRALERLGDPHGGALLVTKLNWSRYTPRIREAAIATLTATPALIAVLFDAIKEGVILPLEISSVRRAQLLKHADDAVRREAESRFKSLEGGDRMQVYRSYRESMITLVAAADPTRGRATFTLVCATCHTHRGTGGKVGPDLTGIRNQPAEAILLHILVPNYEVAPSYQTLSVVTQDGRSVSGWLAAESENSLTLRTAFGTEESVLRKNIATLTASGLSLMPDGLEQAVSKADMAALIAFLKSDN